MAQSVRVDPQSLPTVFHLSGIFGTGTGAPATTRRFSGAVAAIRAASAIHADEGDTRLREHADALRKESRSRSAADDLPIRAIALIAESIRRTRKLQPYDCQLMAGLALTEGRVAEMATGEGKTLVALLPAFVFAMHGRGAHISTVNPYLAARDCDFAQPVFALLGITTGLLEERAPKPKKKAAYDCDVTYGVGTEFGFDYLRDQLAIRAAGGARPHAFHELLLGVARPKPDTVQRGHAFAIIDEADSILLDEARSPLIISMGENAPCKEPAPYLLADQIARTLKHGEDFFSTTPHDPLLLSDTGKFRAHAALTDDALPHLRRVWTHYVEQALHARHRLHRDVHFIVAEGKVVIVDEFTGRPCPDRTWRDGLHQAVEAASAVTITAENPSEATITRPGYFRLYEKACGMTGTAAEAASELREAYDLNVRVVPLNRPCRRTELPDRVFMDRAAKLAAVTRDIFERHGKGQPVLVGTRTVANSEELAELLSKSKFPFRLLNAKQDSDEAEIIAQAGEPGNITIATNMAGRGAHIPLPPQSESAGGLHVIGLERHESARIDRQLIGRAARQGQLGSAQFFLSLDDDLLRRLGPAAAAKFARMTATPEGELPQGTAEHFLRAQRSVEHADRNGRRALAEYDRWIDELKQAL